jgi:hypothetical protein
MNRSAPMRRTPLARGTSKLGTRKGPQRRVVHPFPLPTPGQVVTLEDVRLELHAFGPQAELCRRTMCVACFAVATWRASTWGGPIDWTLLPETGPGSSEAHHEPGRGLSAKRLDRACIGLCPPHHRTGNGDTVRHLLRTDALDARRFYSLLPFPWWDARDEMRRRAALLTTKPVVDATASETR